jgi:putative nucleotidyltransferase with HDIG domain
MTTDRERVERLLSHAGDIPTLPSTVFRIMQLTEDPSCNAGDLAQVLLSDPPLAARVLKLANSAYYGFSQKIASVQQAITLLGFSTLKNVLLSASVFDFYRLGGMGIDLGGLWKHSIATATAAKLIAKRIRYPNVEKAYTVGLLHDIGKIVIARYLPNGLSHVAEMVKTQQCSVYDAETRILGASHADIGAYVLEKWNLPPAVTEAVEFHHHPTRSHFQFYMAAICYLANILAHRSKIGNSGDDMERELDPMVRDYFGLTAQHMQDLQDNLVFKRLEIEAFCALAANRG